MNPLKIICALAFLAAVSAVPSHGKNTGSNSATSNLKPSQWLQPSQLEATPSLEEVNFQRLASMPLQEGAHLIEKLYHLSQINHDLTPSFVPSPSNIPVYIVKANGQNVSANLNTLATVAKQQQNFGDQEVAIIITGLPNSIPTVAKDNRKLVQAFMQRYNGQRQQPQNVNDYDYQANPRTSSEEDYSVSWKSQQNQQSQQGNIVVIDLGATLTNFKRFALFDVNRAGAMVGNAIVELIEQNEMPLEIIRVVGQGIGAHVAGAAGRHFTRLTGHQLRRITALDPSKVFARDPKAVTGLARGDADFVDAIHTSAYGMGTPNRVGDVDFYPNGLSAGVPGATNVIEATMRATRYFAESVRPGNERNFPAVPANSLQQYNNQNGHGRRAYMGIATEYDVKGDYILQVNPNSPFGQSTPAQKQNTYHGVHQSWKNGAMTNQDYE